MSETRLNVRVDDAIKKQAEAVLTALGKNAKARGKRGFMW